VGLLSFLVEGVDSINEAEVPSVPVPFFLQDTLVEGQFGSDALSQMIYVSEQRRKVFAPSIPHLVLQLAQSRCQFVW
jgi:hypothetical protein